MTEIMFYRGPFVIQVPGMKRPNTGGAEFSTGMGAQVCTGNEPYKVLTPVFGFYMLGTSSTRPRQEVFENRD